MTALIPAGAQSFNEILLEKSVGEYEQHVFSQTFNGQPMAERLSRLETVIFGAPQEGISAVREQHLSQVLKPHIKAAAKTPVVPQTAAQTPAQQPAPQATPYQEPDYEPDATSYPTVTSLEREIVGRDFIHEDIATRLARLEQRTFGQIDPQSALVDRVDKLLARYPAARAGASKYSPATPDYPPSALDGLPSNPNAFVGSGRDTYTKLELLEERLLGRTLAGQLITERLDVLEDRAYGYTYSGQSVDTRLSRLMKNSENNFAGVQSSQGRQNIQPRQSYTRPGGPPQTTITQSTTSYDSYGGVPYARTQNIQIGAGIASNSQYSYSPELVQMLPRDLQAQVYQQQAQQNYNPNNANIYSNAYSNAPGSVTMHEERSGPFGSTTSRTTQFQVQPGGQTYSNSNGGGSYQTYSNAPIQYQNYYNTTPQTSLINPPNIYNQNLPQNNSQLNPPMYVGNPAVLTALNDLETRIFNAVNTTDTVPIRITKLETRLIGQTYMGYPDEERINNLAKVYQYQSLSKVLGGGKTGTIIRGVGGAVLGIPLNAPGGAATPTTETTPPTDTGN